MARLNSIIDGPSGVSCIWTGDNDLPFADPWTYADQIKFDSRFKYRRILEVRTFNVTLPRTWSTDQFGVQRVSSANQERRATYTLWAHGRPGIPWVRGTVLLGGVTMSISGSIAVEQSDNPPYGYARMISLGADATNVYLFEYGCQQRGTNNQTGFQPYNTLLLPITVYMTDKLVV